MLLCNLMLRKGCQHTHSAVSLIQVALEQPKSKILKKKKKDSWDRGDIRKKQQQTKASLKTVSFTIYKIQHNSQFPMNQMLFSSPIQLSEVFIIKQQNFNRMGRKPVLSWFE